MKNLKPLRLEKGYTQNQIAQFLQVGNSTVFRWEHSISAPTLFQFLKLCKVLDCTPAQLIGDMDNNTIPVFGENFTIVKAIPVTDELALKNCSFGITVQSALSDRINIGDICFFAFGAMPEKDRIVFASADSYNGQLCIFKEYDADMQIIAVCQFLHSRI